MRVAFILTILMLSTSLAGCLGDDKPDYSGFEGCTEEDDVQCETNLPEGNETLSEGNETNHRIFVCFYFTVMELWI